MVAAVPIILLISKMPPIDSFITTLLEMRLHYQSQIQQSDRLVAQAQDGLTHINALLVDETLDDQQFATNLLQMRLLPALREAQSRYQTTVEEQKRHSANAREQLVHINALLAEQMVVQHGNEQAISMQASAVNDRAALQEAIEARELPTTHQVESAPAAQEEVVAALSNRQPTPSPEQTSSTVIPQGEHREELIENQQSSIDELPTTKEAAPVNRISTSNQPKTPLLPPYQHLSRSEAVERLLQENIGTILHTDYVVRSLYGNLEKEAFKIEKQRLYETLGKGVAKGLWDRVPDQPGCYTIDIKLVEREVKSDKKPASSQQAIAAKSNAPLKLLPDYQHLNYTQAVGTVLRENAGRAMNSEKVARTLYGNLEAEDLSRAKDKIGKILWAGARQKHWQSVAGKLGAYTMQVEEAE